MKEIKKYQLFYDIVNNNIEFKIYFIENKKMLDLCQVYYDVDFDDIDKFVSYNDKYVKVRNNIYFVDIENNSVTHYLNFDDIYDETFFKNNSDSIVYKKNGKLYFHNLIQNLTIDITHVINNIPNIKNYNFNITVGNQRLIIKTFKTNKYNVEYVFIYDIKENKLFDISNEIKVDILINNLNCSMDFLNGKTDFFTVNYKGFIVYCKDTKILHSKSRIFYTKEINAKTKYLAILEDKNKISFYKIIDNKIIEKVDEYVTTEDKIYLFLISNVSENGLFVIFQNKNDLYYQNYLIYDASKQKVIENVQLNTNSIHHRGFMISLLNLHYKDKDKYYYFHFDNNKVMYKHFMILSDIHNVEDIFYAIDTNDDTECLIKIDNQNEYKVITNKTSKSSVVDFIRDEYDSNKICFVTQSNKNSKMEDCLNVSIINVLDKNKNVDFKIEESVNNKFVTQNNIEKFFYISDNLVFINFAYFDLNKRSDKYIYNLHNKEITKIKQIITETLDFSDYFIATLNNNSKNVIVLYDKYGQLICQTDNSVIQDKFKNLFFYNDMFQSKLESKKIYSLKLYNFMNTMKKVYLVDKMTEKLIKPVHKSILKDKLKL